VFVDRKAPAVFFDRKAPPLVVDRKAPPVLVDCKPPPVLVDHKTPSACVDHKTFPEGKDPPNGISGGQNRQRKSHEGQWQHEGPGRKKKKKKNKKNKKLLSECAQQIEKQLSNNSCSGHALSCAYNLRSPGSGNDHDVGIAETLQLDSWDNSEPDERDHRCHISYSEDDGGFHDDEYFHDDGDFHAESSGDPGRRCGMDSLNDWEPEDREWDEELSFKTPYPQTRAGRRLQRRVCKNPSGMRPS